jgi:hypothetical protein
MRLLSPSESVSSERLTRCGTRVGMLVCVSICVQREERRSFCESGVGHVVVSLDREMSGGDVVEPVRIVVRVLYACSRLAFLLCFSRFFFPC